MKRRVAAGLFILAVAASVGWKLASHPETSARLGDISLSQHSEHSYPGPTNGRRVRVRVMLKEFGDEIGGTDQVPQISQTSE